MINKWYPHNSRSGKWLTVGALTVAITGAAVPRALAQEGDKETATDPADHVDGALRRQYDEHLGWITVADPEGYVDGSRLRELAGPDGLMREVSLRGPMLKILAKTYAKRNNKAMADLVSGLDSIEAVVTRPADDDYALHSRGMTDQIEFELKREGWVRSAAVRTDEVDVNAYVLIRDDEIRGVTILVQSKPDQFMFVNLAGRIELDQLSLVNDALDIPGLKQGTDAIEQVGAAKKEKTAAPPAPDAAAQDPDQDSPNKPAPNKKNKAIED